ncbi:MAG: Rha family transcriptional regulator [Peptococcaceae bacterium]|jgi:predicted transcriptional regulator|nr:Rha family transcriptional regulator [Peptococcaceae bacterium]MDH7526014.1 Rha family transcriptional regulator [Peptococcaceae bacterium]
MAKQLTPFGLEVKKRLLDLGLNQKEFCKENDIPMNRLSEVLYGDRLAKKYREKIAKLLDIRMTA